MKFICSTHLGAALTALAALAAVSTSAEAVPMTRTFEFTGSSFVDSVGSTSDPAPTDPATGSVTMTFDENVANGDTLVDAISLTIGGYSYTAADVFFDYSPSSFSGLLNIGRGTIASALSGTDDVYIKFTNVKSGSISPLNLFQFTYTSQIDPTPVDGDVWNAQSGSVQEVPEPATFVLVALGLGLMILPITHRRS